MISNYQKILNVLRRKDKTKFAILLCGILLLGFLEVVGIASILPFMELLAKPDAIAQSSWLTWAYDSFGFTSLRSFMIVSGLFVISVIASSNLLAVVTMYFQLKVSWGIAHDMSARLLKRYMEKPYSYFLKTNTAELRAYIISEVSALANGVLIPLVEFISRSIVCLVIFGLLVFVSPAVTFTMIAFLGSSYLIIYISRQRFLKHMGKIRIQSNSDRFRFMEEMLVGIKTVKIYGVNRFFQERFEKSSKTFSDIQPKVLMTYATPRYLLEIIAFGGILAMTLYLFVSTGDFNKSLPRLTLYAVAGFRLLPALQGAFSSISKVRYNFNALDKLYDDLISRDDSDNLSKATVKKMSFEHVIRIENISFQYEGTETTILDQINLSIEKGSKIAFVGSTGSGKTTLMDLITGLLSPTKGILKVDDTIMNKSNASEWQQNIAYVPQEVFLYDDTIRTNIALGVPTDQINEDQLAIAIKMANIDEFISSLKDGLSSKIGERGVKLSGGQRQRLGLARALYTNPNLLVLDEATSALDSITENGIIESLRSLPEELTVILIAHRISTVRHADIIYVLEEGKIVSSGNYDTLKDSNSKFKRMVQLS